MSRAATPWIAGLALLLAACGGGGPREEYHPASHHVEVLREDPPDNYKLIGPVSAWHGVGCGILGERGDYGVVVQRLRHNAATIGAELVVITRVEQPRQVGSCFRNTFQIDGLAYDKVRDEPSPIEVEHRVDHVDSLDDEDEDESRELSAKELAEELRTLRTLKDEGLLTEAEYQAQKKKLLAP